MSTFRGPFPDVVIPDDTVPGFVLGNAVDRGDGPALIDGPTGRVLSYAQLAGGVRSIASGLAARDFGPRDVAALFMPNIPEYAIVFHAVLRAGGASTTINSLANEHEITEQLAATRTSFLFTIPQFLDRALPAADAAAVDHVFVMGNDAPAGTETFASLFDDRPIVPPEIDPTTTIASMPVSSGTTGFPKVVQLTHRNLVANLLQSDGVIDIRETDVMIGVLPFFHIYGLTVLMNLALYKGATVVTMPRFDLDEFLTLMQEYRVTFACLVPPIVVALAKHPAVDTFDLSALEHVLTGAAPLDASIGRAAADRLGCSVLQGYGLTETSPVISAPTRDQRQARPESTGLILPSTEIQVRDVETGESLGVNDDGEILVRGPQVMAGYLNDPVANDAILEPDGWLHTGDIGHVDGDGYLSVVDRLKELIKYRGFQVPPAELEALLVQHPDVLDAAVVPAPDHNAGEIPKAFLVRAPGSSLTEGEVLSYVSERVPSYKKVRRVEFIDEIPRSFSGKILRRVLVERERERGRVSD